ncbi:glycosyltransferase [Prevotella nigrescens]|uniref:glycosyltransferase n=1 Tax=Prevotella nigrescens TaxID=28133 RepID=UPI00241CAEA6|nr:glycosyltransferase [Prevotella nigrescens]
MSIVCKNCIFSFIIPLYNAEEYIAKCIDSIILSDLKIGEYEIIIVDDGSEDKGTDIVFSYCKSYPFVQYIKQANQGSSVARNAGIEKATGDYIWFVDSDDYLDSALLGKIKNDIIENYFPDIFAIQLKLIDGKTTRIECSQQKVRHNVVLKGRDAILNGYQPSSACAIICKKDFIKKHQLRFYVGISHQDVEFSMRAVALAKNIYFSDYQAYIYIKHSGSVSKPKTVEKQYFYTIGDMYVALSHQKFIEILEDKELQNYILRWSNNILFNLVLSIKRSNNPLIDKNFKKKVITDMKNHGAFPLQGPFTSWKIWLLSKLLNLRYMN